jgi:hypothetical protein
MNGCSAMAREGFCLVCAAHRSKVRQEKLKVAPLITGNEEPLRNYYVAGILP